MKWYKALWFKTAVILFVFFTLALGGAAFILWCFENEAYGIEKSDWLNAMFAWMSAVSAIFIGLVAVWQNERFKKENDKNADLSEKKEREYREALLEVNNRIMKLEESKEYAYITFLQCPGHVVKSGMRTVECASPETDKTYAAYISHEDDVALNEKTEFEFYITNQTDVSIRHIEWLSTEIDRFDFRRKIRKRIASYGKYGFISSPVIAKGEKVRLVLAVYGISDDITACMNPEWEITLRFVIRVTSIFGRYVDQEFCLRLQRSNFYFQQDDPTLFWNYCTELRSAKDNEWEVE